ncbi:MAG: PRC-barrel domain-containing protein [Tardiphaga sp.]
MPAIRFASALAVALTLGGAPSWSADAPIPPPAGAAPAASAPSGPTPAAPATDTPAPAPAPDHAAAPPAAAPPPPAAASAQPAAPEAPSTARPEGAGASPVSKPPSVTVIDAVDAHGILGRDVRSPASENMGRIADVIVDRAGQTRAVVIDFGGFLGVGSRRIVVEWAALHFWNVADKSASITLDLTREQVRAAPEYKDDAPIVVLGASGALQPLRFDPLTMQER